MREDIKKLMSVERAGDIPETQTNSCTQCVKELNCKQYWHQQVCVFVHVRSCMCAFYLLTKRSGIKHGFKCGWNYVMTSRKSQTWHKTEITDSKPASTKRYHVTLSVLGSWRKEGFPARAHENRQSLENLKSLDQIENLNQQFFKLTTTCPRDISCKYIVDKWKVVKFITFSKE